MEPSHFFHHKLKLNSRVINVALLTLLLVLSDVAVSFATRFQLNSDTTPPQNAACSIECGNQRPKPFCGTDGRTYVSKCEVKKARSCFGRTVRRAHDGPCTTVSLAELTKCQLERMQNQQSSGSSSLFVPQCNDDGSYTRVQCHTSFGYCWCVTEDGKPIPGSSVRKGNPSCDRQADDPLADLLGTTRSDQPASSSLVVASSTTTSTAAGRKPPSGERGPGCSQDKRESFNKNLKTIFKEEYSRLQQADMPLLPITSPRAVIEWEKRVIEWKFTELDANDDAILDSRELKPLLRAMKKLVKPKVCAKHFVSHCDLDGDEGLKEMEWSACLGVDNILFPVLEGLSATDTSNNENEQPEEPTLDSSGPQDASPPLLVTRQVPRGGEIDSPVLDVPVLTCENERRRALEERVRTENSIIFVPRCTTTGDYHAVQCHDQAKYCWCVYVDTGRPIPGTSARESAAVACSPLATSRGPITPREFVDCSEDREKRFLIKLIEKIYQEMTATDSLILETTTQAQEVPSANFKEESVIWKFGQLDRNGNNYLETKETASLAPVIDGIKSSKKCRTNFLEYCDANQDERLALREWLHCFDVTPSTVTETPPPRRGRNPFIDRLS